MNYWLSELKRLGPMTIHPDKQKRDVDRKGLSENRAKKPAKIKYKEDSKGKKLTFKQVNRIYKLLNLGLRSKRQILKEYGVSKEELEDKLETYRRISG